MDPTEPQDKTPLFTKALKAILRPLVRVLISEGIPAPEFYRILKQTYVDVSAETLGPSATDSRISVMTGVHRRDVKEMRALTDGDAADLRRKVSTLSTVVGRWLGGANTTDETGAPLPLPRSGPGGDTFEALVQSVSRDVRPRTILDEMIRQKLVSVEGDTVVLSLDALVGPADLDQKVHFFASNVGDHMNAAVENLLSEDPTHFERAVFYNYLSQASVQELEREARELSGRALLRINKKAHALQKQDVADGSGKHRFRYGIFFYQEDEADSAEGKGKI